MELLFGNSALDFILEILGIALLIDIGVKVYKEQKQNKKKDPWLNSLDQDTLDQIKLEKEGNYVGWIDGKPVVFPKKPDNQTKDK